MFIKSGFLIAWFIKIGEIGIEIFSCSGTDN